MKALGGSVMTSTCAPCNNRIGAVSEEQLRRLVAGEVQLELRFNGAKAPRGWRKATATIRQVPTEPSVFHVERGDPELLTALGNDHPFEVRYTLFDQFPIGIAILKYAYLAACVWFRAIPKLEDADSYRKLLMAARDGKDQDPTVHNTVGALVQSLALVENPTTSGSVILTAPTAGRPTWTFVMAGRLAVPWPFNDLLPTEQFADRISYRMAREVGR